MLSINGRIEAKLIEMQVAEEQRRNPDRWKTDDQRKREAEHRQKTERARKEAQARKIAAEAERARLAAEEAERARETDVLELERPVPDIETHPGLALLREINPEIVLVWHATRYRVAMEDVKDRDPECMSYCAMERGPVVALLKVAGLDEMELPTALEAYASAIIGFRVDKHDHSSIIEWVQQHTGTTKDHYSVGPTELIGSQSQLTRSA